MTANGARWSRAIATLGAVAALLAGTAIPPDAFASSSVANTDESGGSQHNRYRHGADVLAQPMYEGQPKNHNQVLLP
jgi:hypothetical protein